MNPDPLIKGIWALFKADTPAGLFNALTGGLHRGTGKVSPTAAMPYGVIDLSDTLRTDTFGSNDSAQSQEGIVQLTFWSDGDDDTEINNIQGLASALYDYCGTDDQDTITVTGWTVYQFTPGLAGVMTDPNNPEKYKLVMDYNVGIQLND